MKNRRKERLSCSIADRRISFVKPNFPVKRFLIEISGNLNPGEGERLQRGAPPSQIFGPGGDIKIKPIYV
jgi:hypothetical protein